MATRKPKPHAPPKLTRLEFRLDEKQQALIERAATYRHQTKAAFIRSVLLKEAQAVVEEQERIILQDAQRDWFLALLENPPEPTPAMRQAQETYQRLIGESE